MNYKGEVMRKKNVVRQSSDTLNLYIYDIIEPDGETSASYFTEELAKYQDIKYINLYVNSGGGILSEGMAIRNQLVRHPARVTAYVDGFACSVAAFILTGCDVVKMYSNSMQFIHNSWAVTAGNSDQLRKDASDLDQIMVGNRKAFLTKSKGKISEQKLIQLLKDETWLTADECLGYGLADVMMAEKIDLKEATQQLKKISELSGGHEIAAKLDKKISSSKKSPDDNKLLRLLEALIR